MKRKLNSKLIAVVGTAALIITSTACSGASRQQAETSSNPNVGAASQPATPAPAAQPSSADKDFLSTAVKDGYGEIQLSQMALQKAHSPAVKEFAQKLIDDHTKTNGDLAKLAANKSVTLPDTKSLGDTVSAGELKILSGSRFDKAYLSKIIDGHKDAISTFQKAAQQGTDTDIKDFASTTVPTLEQHLQMAEELENKTNVHRGSKS